MLSFSIGAILATPPPLTVLNSIAGDDLFNFTTGSPGSCTCAAPQCDDAPLVGHRLLQGESRTFSADGCPYYSIGGGVVAKDGSHCLLWRADTSNCTVSRVGTNRECARLSGAACAFDGAHATLTAAIDRTCDTLPYAHCDPSTSSCCGPGNVCALAKPSTSTYICQPTGGPSPITVHNAISGGGKFNVTTGTPGSCSCENPKCNDSPSAGHVLGDGGVRSFSSDNCAYYSLGGGIVSADGNPCATWRADPGSCSFAPGGLTGECSRVSGASCLFNGTSVTLTANVDTKCDTLPYAGCDPSNSTCCGANNICELAAGSKTYYMCQPMTGGPWPTPSPQVD